MTLDELLGRIEHMQNRLLTERIGMVTAKRANEIEEELRTLRVAYLSLKSAVHVTIKEHAFS